jgi:hypothetical protein
MSSHHKSGVSRTSHCTKAEKHANTRQRVELPWRKIPPPPGIELIHGTQVSL